MIGQRIREARLELGMSVKALALQVGITPSALSQIERGKRSLKIKVLLKITDALSVTPNDILGKNVCVTSDNTNYNIYLSKTDLQILAEIRKHENLYRLLSSERRKEYIASWVRKIS